MNTIVDARGPVLWRVIPQPLRATAIAHTFLSLHEREREYLRRPPRSGPAGDLRWCFYCGRQMTSHRDQAERNADPSTRTVDHVVPRSMKGRTDADNLIGCCQACNCLKSSKSLLVFLLEQPLMSSSHLNGAPRRARRRSRAATIRDPAEVARQREAVPKTWVLRLPPLEHQVWIQTGITVERLNTISTWLSADAMQQWCEQTQHVEPRPSFAQWLSDRFRLTAAGKIRAPWLKESP